MTSKQALVEIIELLTYDQIDVCKKAGYLKTIIQDLESFEQLKKTNRQLKLNFANSRIHSKNCYKKLKAKYIILEEQLQQLLNKEERSD